MGDSRLRLRLAPEIERGTQVADLSQLGHLPVLAHHPTCVRHDHHLLRPFGLALCLGCTCMYAGLATALITLIVAAPPHDWWTSARLGVTALLCAAPPFAQPFIPRRWFKIPARFTLGLGLGLLLGACWSTPPGTLGWTARITMLIAALTLAAAALAVRRRRGDDPCRQCPWGAFPLCAHNLPALRRLRDQRGPEPFLDGLIAELTPLAAYPPRLGAAPPVTRPGQVDFSAPP